MTSPLRTEYTTTILPALKEELKITNVHAVPRVVKVVVGAGIGTLHVQQKKDYAKVITHLAKMVGQKPALRLSRMSISNFKLREGQPVGLVATLRGNRMYDFLSSLVNVALPRVRDFRGISPHGFDGRGNYTLGLREHYIFPQVPVEDDVPAFGFQITVVTSARTDAEAHLLLKKLGFPFRDR